MLTSLGNDKEKLVIDLSCRRSAGEEPRWFVAMDKWQRITEMEVCEGMCLFLIFFVFGPFLPRNCIFVSS